MIASTDQPHVSWTRDRSVRSVRASLARRVALAAFAATLAVSAVGAAVLPTPAPALAAKMVAVADVPLFAGPGASYGILTTIPAGAKVSIDGDSASGYLPVTVDGLSGWVAEGTLSDGGSDASAGEGGGVAYVNGVAVDPETLEPIGDTASSSVSSDGGGGSQPVYDAAPAEYTDYAGSLTPPGGQDTSAGAPSEWSEDQVVGIITEAANAYGQSVDDMVRVAKCESGLNPYAIGSGIYYGLYQFVPSTFAGTPYGDQDIFDPSANAYAAAWMWAQGRKHEWACQ